jgi:hypothetical protein
MSKATWIVARIPDVTPVMEVAIPCLRCGRKE